MAAYCIYNFLPPVSSDLDLLFHDFEKETCHDYKTFATLWKHHKFEYFFKIADIQPNSFRFFLDDSMTVAAAYLCEPWRLPIRIGALYCLFTLYISQIEEPKIKIRLPLESWNDLISMMEVIDQTQNDGKIMFLKMIADNAFSISATRHEVRFYIDKFRVI
ncbi:unnamed protein product [Didymodactylos carnosus]|uniref:Uncharacterized protein n=1 Tax=Didymodactylos carnosus TaxID=1234261 RepID=A0A813W117_9BILA|nr:unnamed protein product [Didymodactylos carnosus]CAF3633138.1 unnamed protein product [Didymodactylos carnosus]